LAEISFFGFAFVRALRKIESFESPTERGTDVIPKRFLLEFVVVLVKNGMSARDIVKKRV